MKGVCFELLPDEKVVDEEVGGPFDAAEYPVGLANPNARGFGMPIVRSSVEANERGLAAGAVPSAFIAMDRTGAAIVRAGGAVGAGLLGVDERPGGGALTLATPAGAGGGADLLAAAGAADALAFSITGTIVALDAGLRLEVWSMTCSNPALATTNGKTAPAPFLTSPFRSSKHDKIGPASGESSEPGEGASACNLSASQPSTEARSAGFVVSILVAIPAYMASNPPLASAIAESVASPAARVPAF
jgi:hypothetical protein